MNRNAIEQLVAERMATALAQHEEHKANAAGAEATRLARAGVVGPAGAGAAGPARAVVGGNGAHEVCGCNYKSFLNWNPHTFSGNKGAVGLSRWFEKLESVFRISGCAKENKTMGFDAAYLTPWTKLKEMMTAEYCSRNEIQKMEQELWNLIVKGDDISGYTCRFYKLTVMCPKMVTPEYKKIERYIWGLPERNQGNVTSSKPATTHDAIHMAHNLMDQVVRAKASRSSNGNKRK
ncbi:putative reverse transcriptase domain-containing protein [Tanacetum coccineum]